MCHPCTRNSEDAQSRLHPDTGHRCRLAHPCNLNSATVRCLKIGLHKQRKASDDAPGRTSEGWPTSLTGVDISEQAGAKHQVCEGWNKWRLQTSPSGKSESKPAAKRRKWTTATATARSKLNMGSQPRGPAHAEPAAPTSWQTLSPEPASAGRC